MALLPAQQKQPSLLTPGSTGGPEAPYGQGALGVPGAPVKMPHQQGFDIWGPLQRRKYMIALFCMIGAGLGYLHFVKAPKVYQSEAQLMITTKAPPTLVNGDLKMESSSLSKHASLIASELVLNEALDEGKLNRLKTFEDVAFPIYELKEMISVKANGKGGETIVLQCVGPVPEDLPKILNQITLAYKQQLEADSQSVGQESKELIEKLESQLSQEKQEAETRYVQLYRELGITTTDNQGKVVNPYNKKLFSLSDDLDAVRRSIRGLEDRLALLKEAVDSGDENQMKGTVRK